MLNNLSRLVATRSSECRKACGACEVRFEHDDLVGTSQYRHEYTMLPRPLDMKEKNIFPEKVTIDQLSSVNGVKGCDVAHVHFKQLLDAAESIHGH